MCGIYGSTIPYSKDQVQKKLERTNFRGPDSLKYTQLKTKNGILSLGHNRLSIIDLDTRSDQPFSYMEHIHIVFNGEIYNFRDIKSELQKKGYAFNTSSDTEVICAAYLEYGNKCVDHFNGMFAFVIYDQKNQKLFGALDRLGQKPFYYYLNGTNFEFASQISSIQLFNQNLTISSKAIDDYLSWGYIPAENSIFNEVKKLKPGYKFDFDLQSGSFDTTCYWDLDRQQKQDFSINYNDAKSELETLITDATKIRLFADVPVGVFLSGGIDSSLITALACKTSNTKVKTFSIKFNDEGFDESSYAQQVANHLKTDHHTILCDKNDGLDLIENFNHFYDEPFSDSSAIPSMLLAKHTREKVTVALTGDAGDENFLGYHRYDWLRIINYFMALPYSIRKIIANGMSKLPNYRYKMVAMVINSKTVEEAYLKSVHDPSPNWKLPSKFDTDLTEFNYLIDAANDIYQRAGNFDLKTYLPYDINVKVDRATMAYSLEARSPLLDYRVVEYAQKLPTNFKYVTHNQKKILKDILYQYVPRQIFDRPKAGFEIPFKEWFRKDLKDFVLSSLNENELRKIPGIKPKEVSKAIDDHMTGKANNYSLIWKLLVLSQWLSSNGKGITIV
ncbi:asparagine synthase (glutamine-hydrolysing) [Maribacter orientalis]|uniref:asparagine synthase (glutamine-hydrolyzing) n=1 Tax=Maribacter orientalis TaxID=228957 RepID=A0A1H7SI78_9FLAO|nr:asparagine synthase (glutamine-hydrolyzing) [Maribacter orientalis]SEL71856.1 asparagine synthase (glutamine-hydrolysing) [Maribacter orientalis]